MSTLNMNVKRYFSTGNVKPKHLFIAGILIIALLAFELFNFDTTRFALENLLGPVLFMGIGWATILAIAFCGIDLAGLVRLFTPQQGKDEPKEVWYLMGAWLLGATMNAVMTWWAVSVTLLNNNFGNEVLSREQLLRYVPIFIAVLVWLTRILFIGSLSMAGDHILGQKTGSKRTQAASQSNGRSAQASQNAKPATASGKPYKAQSSQRQPVQSVPAQASAPVRQPTPSSPPVARSTTPPPARKPTSNNGRVKQRPPQPGIRPTTLSATSQTPR